MNMHNTYYTLKVSPQEQLTLPRYLREQLHMHSGSRIAVVGTDGYLQVSSKLPIEKYFGTMPNLWTADGQDAAEYARELRNAMQPKANRR